MMSNKKRWQDDLSLIIFPLLVAIYPILFLFVGNIHKLELSVLELPVLITLSVVLVSVLILNLVIKDMTRSSLLVTMVVIFFFVYGRLSTLTENIYLGKLRLNDYLVFLYIILLLRCLRSVWTLSKTLTKALPVLLFIIFGLVIYQAGSITVNYFLEKRLTSAQTGLASPVDLQANQPTTASTGRKYPDIYYIILDSYSRPDTLNAEFGLDESDFLARMEQRGFFVASQSSANYVMSFMSISSSLNMGYLDHDLLSTQYKEDGVDYTIPYNLIKNNKVTQLLKQYGYEYIHFSSSYGPTDYNQSADINIQYNNLNEFNNVLLNTTILQPYMDYAAVDIRRQGINATFDGLANLPKSDKPRFIFAHILLPHMPFIFNRDGSRPETINPEYSTNDGSAFVEQVMFANMRVEKLVDEILKQYPDDNQPVIVFQGDHGDTYGKRSSKTDPWPYAVKALDSGQIDDTSRRFIREKSNIFNLYYFPGEVKKLLYPGISPVNTFRLIANAYLGTHFDLLEDKTFFTTYIEAYTLREVPRDLLK